MCQLSEWQITQIRNVSIFFHVSLTLRSALQWAERTTALWPEDASVWGNLSLPNDHGRESFFWPFWIAVFLGWLVHLVFRLPVETPFQVYGECFGHDFMVLHHSTWRLLSLAQQAVVSLSYSPVSQLFPWKHPDDEEFLCALSWL